MAAIDSDDDADDTSKMSPFRVEVHFVDALASARNDIRNSLSALQCSVQVPNVSYDRQTRLGAFVDMIESLAILYAFGVMRTSTGVAVPDVFLDWSNMRSIGHSIVNIFRAEQLLWSNPSVDDEKTLLSRLYNITQSLRPKSSALPIEDAPPGVLQWVRTYWQCSRFRVVQLVIVAYRRMSMTAITYELSDLVSDAISYAIHMQQAILSAAVPSAAAALTKKSTHLFEEEDDDDDEADDERDSNNSGASMIADNNNNNNNNNNDDDVTSTVVKPATSSRSTYTTVPIVSITDPFALVSVSAPVLFENNANNNNNNTTNLSRQNTEPVSSLLDDIAFAAAVPAFVAMQGISTASNIVSGKPADTSSSSNNNNNNNAFDGEYNNAWTHSLINQ
jgi:hypothetical protein